MKVLISAYACEPDKGSEPAVGWHVATEMARHHDVWVLTRANNRENIEAQLGKHPVEGLRFFYHDLPRWASWWKKGGRGVQVYYYLWQLTAISNVRKKHAEIGFDLSHHVTMVKYWAPSCLAWLNIPFVWGPVGGGDSTPLRFLKRGGVAGCLHEFFRDFFRLLSYLDPLIRFTARRSSVCIPVTTKTERSVYRLSPHINSRLMTQVGLSREDMERIDGLRSENIKESDVVFLYVGNLIFLKGVHLALGAFAKAKILGSRFLIVGDGEEKKRLQKLTAALDIEDRVTFCGRLSLDDVMKVMVGATALVHLSLHDSGGFVPIEAMACGKPVICLDLAGSAVLVSEECGVPVPAHSPAQVIEDVAEAMHTTVSDGDLRKRMGEAGRARVEEHFLWEKKAKEFCQVYECVLEGSVTHVRS
jgi:glycosyltransferase involved in cell wall biosynthesis